MLLMLLKIRLDVLLAGLKTISLYFFRCTCKNLAATRASTNVVADIMTLFTVNYKYPPSRKQQLFLFPTLANYAAAAALAVVVV
mmetsp:Transcript_11379/g.22246  ORF Transcript_11379/g.22246 Transcript_11379/m.22246 type:complete len:84 (+) Transcript_11379:1063-1314(+)